MEKNKLNKQDLYFKNSIGNIEATPSHSVWENLESQLSVQKTEEKKSGNKIKKELLIIPFLLIMAGLSVYAFINHKSKNLDYAILEKTSSFKLSNKEKEANNRDEASLNQIKILSNNSNHIAPDKATPTSLAQASNKIEIKTEKERLISKKDTPKENTIQLPEEGIGINKIQNNLDVLKPENKIIKKILLASEIKTIPLKPLALSTKNNIKTSTLSFKSQKDFSRITVSPWYSFDRTFRTLKINENFQDPIATPNYFDNLESSSNSWSAGINFSYNINKSFSIETGTSIVSHRQSINTSFQAIYSSEKLESLFFTSFNTNKITFESNSINGAEIGDLLIFEGNFKQRINHVSIPLLLRYNLYKNRFSFSFSIGPNFNFLQKSKIEYSGSSPEIKNVKNSYSEDAGNTFIGIQSSLKIRYYLHKGTSISIGPKFSKALSSSNKNKSVKYFPYLFGIQIGVEKHLW